MKIKELIRQSWDALTRNRLRSILTMMGIVWGLTTVVLLLGYGQSVSAGVLNAFLGIGNNVMLTSVTGAVLVDCSSAEKLATSPGRATMPPICDPDLLK